MMTPPRPRPTLAELLAGTVWESRSSDAGGGAPPEAPGATMGSKRRYTLAELLAGSAPESGHSDAWDDRGLAFGREFGAEAGGFAPVGREFGAPSGEAGDRSAPERHEED